MAFFEGKNKNKVKYYVWSCSENLSQKLRKKGYIPNQTIQVATENEDYTTIIDSCFFNYWRVFIRKIKKLDFSTCKEIKDYFDNERAKDKRYFPQV